jgi:hypothetical protein
MSDPRIQPFEQKSEILKRPTALDTADCEVHSSKFEGQSKSKV